MRPYVRPTYPLKQVKERIEAGEYVITRTAGVGAGALAFSEEDIVECILGST